jgi:hypothetical protein
MLSTARSDRCKRGPPTTLVTFGQLSMSRVVAIGGGTVTGMMGGWEATPTRRSVGGGTVALVVGGLATLGCEPEHAPRRKSAATAAIIRRFVIARTASIWSDVAMHREVPIRLMSGFHLSRVKTGRADRPPARCRSRSGRRLRILNRDD